MRFGTDGVRGLANVELTPELALALGRAAARVLGRAVPFVVARDTRRSGPLLEAALAAGLAAEGVEVHLVGVAPTPCVAHLGAARGVPGAMISASHNPFADNGIKLFAAGGRKLTDADEERIEQSLDEILAAGPGGDGPVGADVGTIVADTDGVAEYVSHLVDVLAGRRLDGCSVVVDCGHGAASAIAPAVLERLGATVLVLNNAPDGTNINAGCGSTDPSGLQAAVVAHHAAAGLALDGDADRLIAVDERGGLVDGDHLLALAAFDLDGRGRLPNHAVAGTTMANLGLRRALADRGISFVETPVGDRYVLEAMERDGLVLGGEQSGHLVFADHATTGDGILSGLVLLDVMARSGQPLSELARVVVKLPQVLRNVRVGASDALAQAESFWTEVAAVESRLGDGGRVLVRPSGTEPVVRVMVEAETLAAAEEAAQRLEGALVSALGER